MNTGFNVSLVGQVTRENFKDADPNYVYHVELGQDILEGMTEDQIREKARTAMVIDLQGLIRRKGFERGNVCDKLREKYPNIEVMDVTFAEAKAPDNKKVKQIIANLLGISVEKVTDEMVLKAKGMIKE